MNIRAAAITCTGVAVLSGGVTTYLWHELHATREITAELRVDLAESLGPSLIAISQMPILVEGVPVSGPTSLPARVGLETSPGGAGAAATAGIGTYSPTTVARSRDQQSLLHAEQWATRVSALRASIARSNPGLAEALQLAPEEAERFMDRLAEDQIAMMTQGSPTTAGDQGRMTAAGEVIRNREVLRQRQLDALREMLGHARYQLWQDYQSTRPARLQVDAYSGFLTRAGLPLKGGQMKALMTSVLEEQQRLQHELLQSGRAGDNASPLTQAQARDAFSARQAESNQRILDAAEDYLSAQQRRVLRVAFERQGSVSRGAERTGMATGLQ